MRTTKPSTLSVLLLTLALVPSCLVATTPGGPRNPPPTIGTNPPPPGPTQPRYIEGTVTDSVTQAPIGRAAIDITAPSTGKVEFTTTTDGAGNYRTGELPPGQFNIRIRREGYQVLTRMANVTNGPARLDVALIPGR
jgi:hypothetical protein